MPPKEFPKTSEGPMDKFMPRRAATQLPPLTPASTVPTSQLIPPSSTVATPSAPATTSFVPSISLTTYTPTPSSRISYSPTSTPLTPLIDSRLNRRNGSSKPSSTSKRSYRATNRDGDGNGDGNDDDNGDENGIPTHPTTPVVKRRKKAPMPLDWKNKDRFVNEENNEEGLGDRLKMDNVGGLAAVDKLTEGDGLAEGDGFGDEELDNDDEDDELGEAFTPDIEKAANELILCASQLPGELSVEAAKELEPDENDEPDENGEPEENDEELEQLNNAADRQSGMPEVPERESYLQSNLIHDAPADLRNRIADFARNIYYTDRASSAAESEDITHLPEDIQSLWPECHPSMPGKWLTTASRIRAMDPTLRQKDASSSLPELSYASYAN